MIVEAMNYSNPVTDAMRHQWAINHAEHSNVPYSLFGGNIIGGRITRNAAHLPTPALNGCSESCAYHFGGDCTCGARPYEGEE